MHDLSHDDDVLSDILVDNLGYECALSTHKMNHSYRPQRVLASLVRDLVWRKIVVDRSLTGAVDELCMMGIVKKYIADKDQRQLHAFKLHAKRYFEVYHPDSGIEFVQSMRYARASALLKQAAAAGLNVGAAGASAAASTSAVPLNAGPAAPLSSIGPATGSAPIAAKIEDSPVIGIPVPSLSSTVNGAGGSVDAQAVPIPPPQGADVVMTDAQTGVIDSHAPIATAAAPLTNGGAIAASGVVTMQTDGAGPTPETNGASGPGTHVAADPPSTGASTPTSSSAISKGKRRVASENSKSKNTITQQLATSWSDPFNTNAKADMAVISIKAYKEGDFIDGLKGGVKDLTREEDEAMKMEAAAARERLGPGQIAATAAPARDFSVIRSAQKGCSQLLLGPARFVNHDCNPNVEFYRSGQSILFRCTRPIQPKEEITCYYGPNYFEWDNAECLCATCEANGKGAFSALVGTKFGSGMQSQHGSPGTPDGEQAAFSPGPEGSASSANSVNGSEGGVSSSNGGGGGGGGATGAASGSRRASARVAMVQASGRTRRMTPGGVPFPSMSMNPNPVSGNGPLSNQRRSPSSDTNGSSASAAEVDGGIGLGVGLGLPPATVADPTLGITGAFAAGPGGVKGKLVTLTCPTCQDRYEWHLTWFHPQGCARCVRHEKIYRAPWPNRHGLEAEEARRMALEKKEMKNARSAAGSTGGGPGGSGNGGRDRERDREQRAAKKAKLAKKRAEPMRIPIEGGGGGGSVPTAAGESMSAPTTTAAKPSNGKGKEKAVGGLTGMSSVGSSSIASGSADSTGLSSDSDSDLTELASDEDFFDAPTTSMTMDFEKGAGDADRTLGGRGEEGRAGEKRRTAPGGRGGGGDGGAPPLLQNLTNTSFANYASRYGPTGKAPRTALDFQARRREKPEPPWTKADEEDRRRSSRRKTRSRASASGLGKVGESSSSKARGRSSRREEGDSSASSSRSSSPAGPPVLGKDANLQNLADFWGATDGERRVRRPVLSGGVKSLLERQRAEANAKRRQREREEAKAERRRKADRRRRATDGGGAAVAKEEKDPEDVKPGARRSRSPEKAPRRSLDSSLARKESKKASSSSSTHGGTSRKSMDAMQPLRSSNRQALKRDRMLAVGTDEVDDDDDDDDAEDEDSDEDDDFDLSDVSSSSSSDGGEDEDVDMHHASGGAQDSQERGAPRSHKSRSNGSRSHRGASSSDEDDDSGSSDSDDASGSRSHSARRSKKKRFVFSRSSSPQPAIPGLATKGPERTSNANLALAWSAGIAEGTKRTRKPVQREPIAVAKSATSRNSPSATSARGRSSETPNPSSSRDPYHRPSDRSRLRSTSEAGEQEQQDHKRRARTSPAMSAVSASSSAVYASQKGAGGGGGSNSGRQSMPTTTGAARSSTSAAGRGAPTTAGSKYPLGVHPHPSQRILSGPHAGMAAGPTMPGARRYSSSSSSQPDSPATAMNPLPSPANPPVPGFRRPASPAGTPLSLAPLGSGAGLVVGGGVGGGGGGGLAAAPVGGLGAVGLGGAGARGPGAPRKNLRWGSGKVSHSRPSPHLVGGSLPMNSHGHHHQGSTSPVGVASTLAGGALPPAVRAPVSAVKTDPAAVLVAAGRSPAGSPRMGGGAALSSKTLVSPPSTAGSSSAAAAAATATAATTPASAAAASITATASNEKVTTAAAPAKREQ